MMEGVEHEGRLGKPASEKVSETVSVVAAETVLASWQGIV